MQLMFSCPKCGYQVAFGTRFCGHCGNSLVWQLQTTPQPINQQTANSQNQNSLNWFQRHANWTIVLVGFAAFVVYATIVTLVNEIYITNNSSPGSTISPSSAPATLVTSPSVWFQPTGNGNFTTPWNPTGANWKLKWVQESN
jgi:hypothetical protein